MQSLHLGSSPAGTDNEGNSDFVRTAALLVLHMQLLACRLACPLAARMHALLQLEVLTLGAAEADELRALLHALDAAQAQQV